MQKVFEVQDLILRPSDSRCYTLPTELTFFFFIEPTELTSSNLTMLVDIRMLRSAKQHDENETFPCIIFSLGSDLENRLF